MQKVPGFKSPTEQSFLNTILYYKRELALVEKGERATVHFSDRQRKALVKAGILKRVYGRGGCRLRLSKEAKRVLTEAEPSLLQ